MTLEWWHWLAAGLALIVVEVTASGGFYFIFFGAGAIIVAALRLLDLAEPLWLQLLVFSVLSVVSLLVFRNPLLRWMKRSAGFEERTNINTGRGDRAGQSVGAVGHQSAAL